MEIIETHSERETLEVAIDFAQTIIPGTVVALCGDLGSGKTVFAKGVAEYLDVRVPVTSPTFTLINEYNGKLSLYHMDLYRLNDEREIEDIGVEDYFYGDGICLVEWAEKLGDLMPSEAIIVTISRNGAHRRSISIERPGAS